MQVRLIPRRHDIFKHVGHFQFPRHGRLVLDSVPQGPVHTDVDETLNQFANRDASVVSAAIQ